MEIWPGPCGGPLRATLPEGECIKVNCPEEPGAGILHAGICEGGAGQPASLPRQWCKNGSYRRRHWQPRNIRNTQKTVSHKKAQEVTKNPIFEAQMTRMNADFT